MIKVLEKLKTYIIKKQANDRFREKQKAIELITKEWTEEEIYMYNLEAFCRAEGFFGKMSIDQIKNTILSMNYNYFTNEEYDTYYNLINKEKSKIR